MEPGLPDSSDHRPPARIAIRFPGALLGLYSSAMELAEALKQSLERLLAAGRVEVQEDGCWLAELEGFDYEVRQKNDAVLLHLWSGQSNFVRRVLRVAVDKPGRFALEVARFGRARPNTLEFLSARRARDSGQVRREQFRAHFADILAHQFPDEKIVSLTSAADLEHSLSGSYVRGVLLDGRRAWAVLAAAPGESGATYDGLLTFGLLWLDRARRSKQRAAVAGLRLFFPQGCGRVTAQRWQALSSSTTAELYEYSPESRRVRLCDPGDAGNIESWLAPRREIETILARAEPAVAQIRRLAPEAIETEVIAGTSQVAVRFRGLLFARWQREGIVFGVDGPEQQLTPDREPELERLVREIEAHRSALASSPQHPLYRAQPERWLQSLVMADPGRIDPRLDPRFLYAQVPAISGGDRGVMDLVGVTRGGRLAVIELKASEDLQLTFQAVDYWLRVRSHQAKQDFPRYGYFTGITLDPRPPLLYLVAPSLQFHPAGDVLLPYLSRDLEICRAGLNEHWRRGLRVVLRQTLRPA